MIDDSRETRMLAVETKCLVDADRAAAIRAWARRYLDADPHGGGAWRDEYETTTLYLDTPALDVLQRRGSYARAKYRVRRYGHAAVAYLERKLRNARGLSKRRTAIPIDELGRVNDLAPDTWAGAWFHRRVQLRDLQPTLQLSYRRTARVADTDGGTVRLTVDDELRTRSTAVLQFADGTHARVLAGAAIVELKFRRSAPALFRRLMQDFDLTPLAISKYRLGAAALPELSIAAGLSSPSLANLLPPLIVAAVPVRPSA